MKYTGIDLHSNNCIVVVIDETNRALYRKRSAAHAAQKAQHHSLVGSSHASITEAPYGAGHELTLIPGWKRLRLEYSPDMLHNVNRLPM